MTNYIVNLNDISEISKTVEEKNQYCYVYDQGEYLAVNITIKIKKTNTEAVKKLTANPVPGKLRTETKEDVRFQLPHDSCSMLSYAHYLNWLNLRKLMKKEIQIEARNLTKIVLKNAFKKIIGDDGNVDWAETKKQTLLAYYSTLRKEKLHSPIRSLENAINNYAIRLNLHKTDRSYDELTKTRKYYTITKDFKMKTYDDPNKFKKEQMYVILEQYDILKADLDMVRHYCRKVRPIFRRFEMLGKEAKITYDLIKPYVFVHKIVKDRIPKVVAKKKLEPKKEFDALGWFGEALHSIKDMPNENRPKEVYGEEVEEEVEEEVDRTLIAAH